MLATHPRQIRLALIAGAAIVLGACAEPPSSPSSIAIEDRYGTQVPWAGNPELSKALAALRDTTDIYHDVNVALAAGYRPSVAGCESSSTGAMGIHYGHPALLGVVRGSSPVRGTDPFIDPLRPEVLLYEPQADGTRRLVGVEFVVYRAAWDAANPTTKPTFHSMRCSVPSRTDIRITTSFTSGSGGIIRSVCSHPGIPKSAALSEIQNTVRAQLEGHGFDGILSGSRVLRFPRIPAQWHSSNRRSRRYFSNGAAVMLRL